MGFKMEEGRWWKRETKRSRSFNKALLVWRFPFHRHRQWIISSRFFLCSFGWTTEMNRVELRSNFAIEKCPHGVIQVAVVVRKSRSSYTLAHQNKKSQKNRFDRQFSESWRLKWTSSSFIFNNEIALQWISFLHEMRYWGNFSIIVDMTIVVEWEKKMK